MGALNNQPIPFNFFNHFQQPSTSPKLPEENCLIPVTFTYIEYAYQEKKSDEENLQIGTSAHFPIIQISKSAHQHISKSFRANSAHYDSAPYRPFRAVATASSLFLSPH